MSLHWQTREYVKTAFIGSFGGLGMGLFGVSAGAVLVPAYILFLAWDQKLAQGTALAVSLPPLGILAALEYHRQGDVRLEVAALMALGLLVGGYFGGRLATRIPQERLRRLFAAFLLIIGGKMLLGL